MKSIPYVVYGNHQFFVDLLLVNQVGAEALISELIQVLNVSLQKVGVFKSCDVPHLKVGLEFAN